MLIQVPVIGVGDTDDAPKLIRDCSFTTGSENILKHNIKKLLTLKQCNKNYHKRINIINSLKTLKMSQIENFIKQSFVLFIFNMELINYFRVSQLVYKLKTSIY